MDNNHPANPNGDPNRSPSRQQHDDATKREAVNLLLSGSMTAKEVAAQLGINLWTLRGWKKKFRLEASSADPAKTLADLQAEIRSLRRELFRARQRGRTLKDALTILAGSPVREPGD